MTNIIQMIIWWNFESKWSNRSLKKLLQPFLLFHFSIATVPGYGVGKGQKIIFKLNSSYAIRFQNAFDNDHS